MMWASGLTGMFGVLCCVVLCRVCRAADISDLTSKNDMCQRPDGRVVCCAVLCCAVPCCAMPAGLHSCQT